MQLRFYIRQHQYVNLQGNPIIFTGSSPNTLMPTSGTVDNVWHDFSKDVINLDKISLQWTVERDSSGGLVSGKFEPKKAASGVIKIDGEAYRYVRAWLIDNIAAPFNSIEVKIEDTTCGYFEAYQIKATQVAWCETQVCEFELTLKQIDDAYRCIQKTVVSDNWQGWFQKEPKHGKKHPRFSYCNEMRPNGMLVVAWWFLAMMGIVFAPLIVVMVALVNAFTAVINAIVWLLSMLGFKVKPVKYDNPFGVFDVINTMLPGERWLRT